MTKNYIEMGACKKPHGIKGAFLFHLYNSEDSSIHKGSKLKLIPINKESTLEEDGEIFTIKSINFASKTICYLEEVDNRNLVEKLIPFTIHLDREEFKNIDDDEVYLSDLEGLTVLNEQKEKIGSVKSFYDHGATPILVVEHFDGTITELPFVESFFPEVDLEKKCIVMISAEVV